MRFGGAGATLGGRSRFSDWRTLYSAGGIYEVPGVDSTLAVEARVAVEAVAAVIDVIPQAGLALEVRDLRKSYGDFCAVDGVDLCVPTGACFGLLGPNGAGKTTTMEICEGLLEPDSGSVRVLDFVWDRDRAVLRQRLGIQLQESRLSEKLSVAETVRLFRSFYCRGHPVDTLIDLVSLRDKRNARVSTLSGGQAQRLSIACALSGDPDLLFLDEPTTGLDPQSRRQLWSLLEALRERNKTIVLTTHYMDEAERLCDYVAIVDCGRVIATGKPRDLIRSIGTQEVVECSFAGAETVPISVLAAMPGVLRVQSEAGVTRLESTAAHETASALLRYVDDQKRLLTELRIFSPTLEDVFVFLTGRQIRNG